MRVDQLMTRTVKTCAPTDTLNTAADIMWKNDCGCVPVVDADAHVVGIVTDRDIAMAAYTGGQPLASIPVEVAMAHVIKACHDDEDVATAEFVMRANQIRRVPVLDHEDHLVGMLSLNDIARAAAEPQRVGIRFIEDLARTVAGICRPRAMSEPAADEGDEEARHDVAAEEIVLLH